MLAKHAPNCEWIRIGWIFYFQTIKKRIRRFDCIKISSTGEFSIKYFFRNDRIYKNNSFYPNTHISLLIKLYYFSFYFREVAGVAFGEYCPSVCTFGEFALDLAEFFCWNHCNEFYFVGVDGI